MQLQFCRQWRLRVVGETIPIINEQTGVMVGVVSEANIFDAYLTTQSQVHDLEHN